MPLDSPYVNVNGVPVTRLGPKHHNGVLRSNVPLDHPDRPQGRAFGPGGIRTDYPEGYRDNVPMEHHVHGKHSPTCKPAPAHPPHQGIATNPCANQSDVFPHQPALHSPGRLQSVSTSPKAHESWAPLAHCDAGHPENLRLNNSRPRNVDGQNRGRASDGWGTHSQVPLAHPSSAGSSSPKAGKRTNPVAYKSNVIFGDQYGRGDRE